MERERGCLAHMHVREPDGKPSRKLEYYKEVADRIRSSDTDVVINFTTGMGGDFEVGEGKDDHPPSMSFVTFLN